LTLQDRDRARYSPDCAHITAGSWSDPSVLEGHWDDHSSQIAVATRTGGFTFTKDEYLIGQPSRLVSNPEVRHFPRESERRIIFY